MAVINWLYLRRVAKFLFYFSYLMALVYVAFGIGFIAGMMPGLAEPYNYLGGGALIIYGVFRAFRIRRDFAYLNHHHAAQQPTDNDRKENA